MKRFKQTELYNVDKSVVENINMITERHIVVVAQLLTSTALENLAEQASH